MQANCSQREWNFPDVDDVCFSTNYSGFKIVIDSEVVDSTRNNAHLERGFIHSLASR